MWAVTMQKSRTIMNSNGPITATSLDLTVIAKGGAGTEEATGVAKGLDNNGNSTITTTSGANILTVQSYGGKSNSTTETGNVSARAYGINNASQVNMSGTTTLAGNATGGKPATMSGTDVYLADDASAAAYGINNEGTNMILVEELI